MVKNQNRAKSEFSVQFNKNLLRFTLLAAFCMLLAIVSYVLELPDFVFIAIAVVFGGIGRHWVTTVWIRTRGPVEPKQPVKHDGER